MITELPDDWYEEESMQRLILNPQKVIAEINRLRSALQKIAESSYSSAGRALSPSEMIELAEATLGESLDNP